MIYEISFWYYRFIDYGLPIFALIIFLRKGISLTRLLKSGVACIIVFLLNFIVDLFSWWGISGIPTFEIWHLMAISFLPLGYSLIKERPLIFLAIFKITQLILGAIGILCFAKNIA